MKCIIRIGDKTTGGGAVLSGSSTMHLGRRGDEICRCSEITRSDDGSTVV